MAAPRTTKSEAALQDLLDHYVRLVESGDAGSWDPEREIVVQKARVALGKDPATIPGWVRVERVLTEDDRVLYVRVTAKNAQAFEEYVPEAAIAAYELAERRLEDAAADLNTYF